MFALGYGLKFGTARIDQISGLDFSRALIKAADKLLTSKELPGTAMFVTKGRELETPEVSRPQVYMAKKLRWPLVRLPDWLLFYCVYWSDLCLSEVLIAMGLKKRLAVPVRCVVRSSFTDMTFDNSLARKVLEFQPLESWKDACDRVVEDWKQQNKQA